MKVVRFLCSVTVLAAVVSCSTVPAETACDSPASSIPQGTYTGEVTVSGTITLTSASESETIPRGPDVNPFTRAFGPVGQLLDAQGAPICIGDYREYESNGILISSTVRQITVGLDQIAILSDFARAGPVSGYEQAELVGTQQETYEYLETGEVRLTLETNISGSPEEGVTIELESSGVGTLSQ